MSQTFNQASSLQNPNIFGMIYEPNKQFKLIQRASLVLKPLLIVSLITILSGIIIFQGIDLTTDSTLRALSSRELLDVQIFNIVNSIILAMITIIIYSLIHFLAAKVLKSKVTIVQLISMNTYIAIIPALGVLINAILFYIFKDSIDVASYTSLGNLVKSNNVLKAALTNFEVFMIWQFIIMALGLHVVAQFPKKAAWVIVLLFFFMLVSLEMSVAGSGLMN